MQNSRSVILTLAHQLLSNGICSNFSEAQKQAWATSKEESLSVITFTKKGAEKPTKRVVTQNLSKYYSSKNSGKKKPEGLTLFVDMAKVVKGLPYVIISAYDFEKVA